MRCFLIISSVTLFLVCIAGYCSTYGFTAITYMIGAILCLLLGLAYFVSLIIPGLLKHWYNYKARVRRELKLTYSELNGTPTILAVVPSRLALWAMPYVLVFDDIYYLAFTKKSNASTEFVYIADDVYADNLTDRQLCDRERLDGLTVSDCAGMFC